MLLVSGATKTTARFASDERLGALLRPGNGNMPGACPWGVDNGAFTGFDEKAFRALLGRLQGKPGCLWVAAPDVVGDAAATLVLFAQWEPEIRGLGFPLALVAQDGLTDAMVPWDRLECLFIGGSTDWKLGPAARELVRLAKSRGKLVHMGRVNTIRRMRYAHEIGVDSIDGTQFSRFAEAWLGWGLNAMARIEAQQVMWRLL